MKLYFFALTIFLCYGCKSGELKIIPLSPYEEGSLDGGVKSGFYYFAIDNFDSGDFPFVDSFVLEKVNKAKEYIQDNHALYFIFYKYEKGKMDENLSIRKNQNKRIST